MKDQAKHLLPLVVRVAIPAILGGCGAILAAVNMDWFRAFCGV